MKFETLFGGRKPLIGMIHTGCMHGEDMLDTAKREIEIYLEYGVYPLIENYFGTSADCEKVMVWLQEYHPKAVYGVNILGDPYEAILLAGAYGAKFIQIDSVCSHLDPEKDEEYAEDFKAVLNDFPVIVRAGVSLDTIEETFRLADGAIVGSWFKDEHVDTGHVNEEYVRQMVEKIVLRQSNLKEE